MPCGFVLAVSCYAFTFKVMLGGRFLHNRIKNFKHIIKG